MSSPSSRRKQGRERFHPGEDWELSCPYKTGTFEAEDFLDGWNEAAAEWYSNQEENMKEYERFKSLSNSCPWHSMDNDFCVAVNEPCSEEWCAVWHFIGEKE
jgi:hypothetical protein